MSIYATKWAYAQPVKPAGRKFVLVALADFADAEGRAFPGAETIATMTGQDERSVRRHIDALEKSGYIKCMERRRRDGSRTTDEVWLQAPADALKPHPAATGQSARKSTGQNARLQDQPDNLTRPTGQFDQTNRTICPGPPVNLSGRTEPSLNHHQEPSLEPPPSPDLAALAAEGAPVQDPEQQDPTQPWGAEGGDHTPAQVHSPANAEPGKATSTEDVPPAAPRRRLSDPARIIAAWNDHRGTLPEVQGLNEGRKKAIARLLRECGGDVERAAQVVTDATREVAADEYWQSHRYGFDNLVPGKVFGRAEAWRSRQPGTTAAPEARPPALTTRTLHEGQRVMYKREAYTVERLTDTAAYLDDPENGSVTVLLASSDWNAIKPIDRGNA